jgi:hypothetical protein
MKGIVAILTENPFYFTIPLQERYRLVKRLMSKEQGEDQPHDLSRYERKVAQFLQAE